MKIDLSPSVTALVGAVIFLLLVAGIKIGEGVTIERFAHELTVDPMEVPLLIAPAFVFALTVHAYYRFIIEYNGAVAKVSLLSLLIAACLCVGLALSQTWWWHLRWMYLLFLSYVTWDIIMLELMPRSTPGSASSSSLTSHHLSEVDFVSTYINQPTLLTIFCIWIFVNKSLVAAYPAETLRPFIAGVVSFHLIFSGVAYILGYRFPPFSAHMDSKHA